MVETTAPVDFSVGRQAGRTRGRDRRYATLDAIRGIAALFIVARHFSDLRGPSEPQFSFLAVDLFFSMSGFVLSLSYLARLRGGMTVWTFVVVRVVRLYPLYALGALSGLSVLSLSLLDGQIDGGTFAISILGAVLALPSPPSRFSPALFPYLVPAWSLFFEFFVANLLFALWARKLGAGWLPAIVVVSGILLWVYAGRMCSFDVGANWDNALGGFPRVIFSFFVGVALQLFHRAYLDRLEIPSPIPVLSTIILLSLPVPAGWDFRYEAICIFALFPLLILIGAGSFERAPVVGVALGDMSYAIYTLHYPLLIILGRIMIHYKVYPGLKAEALFIVAVSLFAYVASRYFDMPARRLCRSMISTFRPTVLR